MAKQNIISGGFYGKVGELIGQRWKNIRTVRAYTKPKNPRTAKQQANRQSFGSLVPKAQLAMQLNYHAGYFSSESNSEWGLRMSLAASLLKAGYELLNLLPIIPLGYSPAYVISEITAIDLSNKRKPIFYVNGNLPNVDRSISVVISLLDEKTKKYEDFVFSTTLKSGTKHSFEIEFTFDVEINKMSRFIIVSNNDSEEKPSSADGNTTIASKMLAYSPVEPITMEIKVYEKTKLANPYITFDASVGSLAAIGITDNQTLLQVWSPTGTSNANIKYNIYDAENEVPAVLSANTTINKLKYVSDTTIRVTLEIDGSLAKTQAFEKIVLAPAESLFIKPVDNTKPLLYVPLIENQELPHEIFVQPSPIYLSPLTFNESKLKSNIVLFVSDVDDLASIGIINNETLANVWNVAKSTISSGNFKIYDADASGLIPKTANTKISSLEYVSNTQIKVSLNIDLALTDLQSIAEITNIKAGTMEIESSRIIYPNLRLNAIINQTVPYETFTQPAAIKTGTSNYTRTALNSKKIIFLSNVRSLTQYGITSQATLQNAWTVSKATSGNGTFSIYTAGAGADKTVTVKVTLDNLEYVSDTSVRVTLNVDYPVDDISAISGIQSIADNLINITANSVRYPNFGISAITSVSLPHETFTKPTTVVTSNHRYEVMDVDSIYIVFAATVPSLAKYGITNTATLKSVWNPANTSISKGSFGVFNTETEEIREETATTYIEDLAYISDTEIKVTIAAECSLDTGDVINTIVSIAHGALQITNPDIRKPNFEVQGMTDVELDF